LEAALLAATWKNHRDGESTRVAFRVQGNGGSAVAALEALLAAGDSQALDGAAAILPTQRSDGKFRAKSWRSGRSEDARVAKSSCRAMLIQAGQKPKVIELLRSARPGANRFGSGRGRQDSRSA